MQSLMVGALLLSGCTGGKKGEAEVKKPSQQAENSGQAQEGQNTGDASSNGSVTSGDSGAATVYVVNFANEDVCYLYVGDGTVWTDDILGANTLPIGYYVEVTGVNEGFVEIYAQGCSSADWYASGTVSTSYTFTLVGGGSDSGYYYYYDTGYY